MRADREMKQQKRIVWTNEIRQLADLKPQEDNPREIRAEQAERLKESWDDYGQVDLLAIGPEGEIYNGHQRYYILLDRHGPEYEVECRVASRALERQEWQRLTVLLHEGAVGEWDFDALANWDGVDFSDLLEWGFDERTLGMIDFPTRPDFSDLIEELDTGKKGTSTKDENWFYVEFYQDDERHQEMFSRLQPHLKGQSKHELDNDFFYGMVMAYVDAGDAEAERS